MTAALAPRSILPGELREDGIALPPDLSFEAWRDALVMAELIERASPWWVVDLMAYGQDHFGEDHTHALPTAEDDPTGARQSRLKQAAWMATKYPPNTRVPGLTYTHHRAVAELEPDDRQTLLREAAAEQLSTRELIARAQARKAALRLDDAAPVCAAEAPLSVADLLPEWRARAEASGEPRGYLAALIDTRAEACFRVWRD